MATDQQEKRAEQCHPITSGSAPQSERRYDVVILGAGWGGLAAATLLAKAGRRVAVLEAQDRAGGCGQSFSRDGFSFCAEMQYLMGCAPGGIVHRWLHDLGLDGVVAFNSLDRSGYDRIDLPGGTFRIPIDPRQYEAALCAAFPDDRPGITKLFSIMARIEKESETVGINLEHIERHPFEFAETALYGMWPVARVFEHLKLSPRVRAVIAGQCGDAGLGPREEPFLCLQALIFGYGASVHFPKQGMGYFVDRIVQSLVSDGGAIHYDTSAMRINREGNRIASVETSRGTYTAETFISNIDPARTFAMIDGGPTTKYEQSTSCFTVFLGINTDLSNHGFGRFNVWSYPTEDLDDAIDRSLLRHEYDDPFFFLSTPSLYADAGVLAPPGSTTVQINAPADFDWFATAMQEGRHDQAREQAAEAIVNAVERRLVPGLRKHRVVQEAWSPVDLAARVGLDRGGIYGARLDFHNRVLRRVPQHTPFENLYLTGATAGGPGLQGVVGASRKLVDRLLARCG